MNEIISEIKELHRKRVDFHRTEKATTLRIKAVCRRLCDGDKTEAEKLYKALDSLNHPQALYAADYVEPMRQAKNVLEVERKKCEKQAGKLAKQLPVWSWVEGVRGVGPLALAQIIGEAGDLGNYPNPAKLWKRMGLAVINGERQRKVSGAAALEHGYSPERRSIMFVIGDSIIKCGGYYADLYRARKQIEETKLLEGTKGHHHNRAKRYMEKKLLRDLWAAWKATNKENLEAEKVEV